MFFPTVVCEDWCLTLSVRPWMQEGGTESICENLCGYCVCCSEKTRKGCV